MPSGRCVCSVHVGVLLSLGVASHLVSCRALGHLAVSELRGAVTAPLDLLLIYMLRMTDALRKRVWEKDFCDKQLFWDMNGFFLIPCVSVVVCK